ncbi:BTAD domain-containing putative transcriptional regulator [Micromonospora sp. NPDC048887]|uniref:BTAD domain-containing putative transcriptional regulator n=1 Tax=unclassified Micromonospora TaxID=2617518 RepID=UPI0033D80B7A
MTDAPFAGVEAARLRAARLAAVEDRVEAELALAPAAEPLIAELRDLVAAHPLRERLHGLLMRALHGAGRRAEALAVYADARRVLAEELGTDPSAELAALHTALLRDDAAPPARLPSPLTSFVGRDGELRRVGELLGAARLVTLHGPGGAGKLVGWQWRDGVGRALAAVALILLLRVALTWVGILFGLLVPNPDTVAVVVFPLAFPLTALSNVFVAPELMPHWLGAIAAWNPLSATVAAARDLFGNPGLGGDTWPARHALELAIAWPLALIAVAAPAAVRRYRRLGR